jgi:hypothetical protein
MVIVDERTYTCHPGKLAAFLDIYERQGKPIQWPILGEPVGFFITEVGELQQVVHWWRYDSLAERERRRAELSSAPGWADYLTAALPNLARMENRLLTPTKFSPLQ